MGKAGGVNPVFIACNQASGCATSPIFNSQPLAGTPNNLVGIDVVALTPQTSQTSSTAAMAYSDGASLYYAECTGRLPRGGGQLDGGQPRARDGVDLHLPGDLKLNFFAILWHGSLPQHQL